MVLILVCYYTNNILRVKGKFLTVGSNT